MAAALVGSVLPDVDMVWFYLVDSSLHHHQFITHKPIVWIAIALAGLITRPWVLALGLAGVLHCGLDTIAGAVTWGWPVWEHATTLVHVPATRSHWILSFLTHWTFAVEVVTTLIAGFVWWRSSHVNRQS